MPASRAKASMAAVMETSCRLIGRSAEADTMALLAVCKLASAIALLTNILGEALLMDTLATGSLVAAMVTGWPPTPAASLAGGLVAVTPASAGLAPGALVWHKADWCRTNPAISVATSILVSFMALLLFAPTRGVDERND